VTHHVALVAVARRLASAFVDSLSLSLGCCLLIRLLQLKQKLKGQRALFPTACLNACNEIFGLVKEESESLVYELLLVMYILLCVGHSNSLFLIPLLIRASCIQYPITLAQLLLQVNQNQVHTEIEAMVF